MSHGAHLSLFLGGDVMTGRGIDQILPHAGDPLLHESYVRDAGDYVRLAERCNGPVPRPADFAYPWGEALAELERRRPRLRIVNLETSVTSSDHYQADKGIHYRMHPANVPCLTSAGLDCCVLANNHVLDWGEDGLAETLRVLAAAGIAQAGAGDDAATAARPAALDAGAGRRLLVFAWALASSGVPARWAAAVDRPGINYLPSAAATQVDRVIAAVAAARRHVDRVMVSLHWGGNWGYPVPREHRTMARRLVDEAGVDLVHGHSSHHPLALEVHGGRLILYGCGDLLNDYEGIRGYEAFRGDLAFMYFPVLHGDGRLAELSLVPLQMRRLRLCPASSEDAAWMAQRLTEQGRRFGVRADADDGRLHVTW